MGDFIEDIIKPTGEELGEIGKNVLETGATFIAPVAIAGIVIVGINKMFDGFRK